MRYQILIIFIFFNLSLFSQIVPIQDSRDNSVKIFSISGNSSGTGFFIDKYHVATCFHVIAKVNSDTIIYYNDLVVLTGSGEYIKAKLTTRLAPEDSTPLKHDFAILSLITKPKKIKILELKYDSSYKIGSSIVFSGFPFGVSTMLTHQGYISGFNNDSSVICFQSSINKGNSGGALINEKSQIIGIITRKAGGISKELETILDKIKSSKKIMTVKQYGVNQQDAQQEIIQIIDTYISTGIGYAYSVEYLIKWYDIYIK